MRLLQPLPPAATLVCSLANTGLCLCTRPDSEAATSTTSHLFQNARALVYLKRPWRPRMQKAATVRVATASGVVHMSRAAIALVRENRVAKGDVLRTAQLAGIMAAKLTPTLIPLCHNIAISKADVRSSVDEARGCVRITSEVRTVGATGVEMEALTAVSVAALTVYDMCKAVDKSIRISDVQLDAKAGGRSGDYRRGEAAAA